MSDEGVSPSDPSGDRLSELFAAHGDLVWRTLARLGVPRPEVDDLVQEVFLVAQRKLPHYDEQGHERAWLVAICRRVAADARKAGRRRTAREAEPPPGFGGREPIDPERAAAQREAAAFVQNFLDGLDPDRRAVFVLCDLEGLSAPEASAALGIKLNTVYSRLRVAREKLEATVRRHQARDRSTR
jgi:RNA polymerase sigma-70 factor (ECF subfamily)